MIIEVGKSYLTRDKRIVEVVSINPDVQHYYPVEGREKGSKHIMSWTRNGYFFNDGIRNMQHPLDFMKEANV